MKKFLSTITAILFSACFLFPTLTSAEDRPDDEGLEAGKNIEKFYDTLPQAKGNYKSSARPILIEGAMNIETEVFIRALKSPVVYKDLNYLFVAGSYKNYPVVIVRTEQGMANAAASTALAIKKFNPVAVINQGTAGGHDANIKVNDIVIGERAIDFTAVKTAYKAQGEGVDLTDQEMLGTFAYDKKTDTFQNYKEYFADPTLLKISKAVADSHGEFKVVSGTISTSDAWLTNVDYTNFLHEKYGSSCEEMETSEAAQICKNADIPFIGIRSISNNITNGENFDDSVADYNQNFVLLMIDEYINSISKK